MTMALPVGAAITGIRWNRLLARLVRADEQRPLHVGA